MWSIVVFWAGACLGSFINVLAYRIPREESVVFPRSRCPSCAKTISFYDNIPVLGWLMLRGRCRFCRWKIPVRYPAVEAAMSALAYALWRRWPDNPYWAAAAILAAGTFLVVTLIDWDTFLIPDELSLGLFGAGLIVAPINPLLMDSSWLYSILYSCGGAAVGLGLCWGTAVCGEKIFKKEAMGGGDIKLMAGIGAWTGALGAFDCIITASFLGSIYGVSLIARGRLTRSDPIPFGPFLSAGAVFNFFYLLPLGFPFA